MTDWVQWAAGQRCNGLQGRGAIIAWQRCSGLHLRGAMSCTLQILHGYRFMPYIILFPKCFRGMVRRSLPDDRERGESGDIETIYRGRATLADLGTRQHAIGFEAAQNVLGVAHLHAGFASELGDRGPGDALLVGPIGEGEQGEECATFIGRAFPHKRHNVDTHGSASRSTASAGGSWIWSVRCRRVPHRPTVSSPHAPRR